MNSTSQFILKVQAAQDPNNPTIGQLINRTIKRLYREQGFYAALNFMARAGLISGMDQDQAEAELMEVIHG